MKCLNKYKNCHIPYPYYDKKSNIIKWIMYNETTKQIEKNNSLQDALENNIQNNLIYHYKAKIYKVDEMKYQKEICHCHSFDEIIKVLYKYPESFLIPKEYKNEYSNQELKLLKEFKNYLLLIGLKDYKISDERLNLEKKYIKIYKKKNKSIIDKVMMFYLDKKEQKLINKEKYMRCVNIKNK